MGLFFTTPQPTTRNVLRPYALHVLFVPPAPASDGVFDCVAAPARDPVSRSYDTGFDAKACGCGGTTPRLSLVLTMEGQASGNSARRTCRRALRHALPILLIALC